MTTNAELWRRREAAVPQGVSSIHQRFFARGANAEAFDEEGNRYIDLATGIAVCNTGHGDPRIIDAVKRQLDAFSHCSFQVTPYESYIALAEQLNGCAPRTYWTARCCHVPRWLSRTHFACAGYDRQGSSLQSEVWPDADRRLSHAVSDTLSWFFRRTGDRGP